MSEHNIKVVLAFDFGTKRIGVAVGQTVTKTARPLDMLPAKEGEPDWNNIAALIKKWQPQAFVVGIPLNMDGSEQRITQNARDFVNRLSAKTNLPVYEMDERLSTKDARERLFEQGGYKALQGGQVDCVAAQLILQNWLEENA